MKNINGVWIYKFLLNIRQEKDCTKDKEAVCALIQLDLPAGSLSLHGFYSFIPPSLTPNINPFNPLLLSALQSSVLALPLCVYSNTAPQSSHSVSVSDSASPLLFSVWGISEILMLQLLRHEITPGLPTGS